MVKEFQETQAKLKSNELLKMFMGRHDWTVRTLADEVDLRLRRDYQKRAKVDPRAPKRCRRGTIGNLSSGYRALCHADVAVKIAEIFDVPTQSLFETKVSTIYRETGHRSVA